MAHIIIVGSGLGGMTMAFEMRENARPTDRITVVSNNPTFHFVPSNPWVAVNWRKREEIELDAGATLGKHKIDFIGVGVKRLHPESNRVELDDGRFLDYDFLIVSTGPKLAFDEIEGLGPQGHTQSICHVDHAVKAEEAWQKFVADPGPIVAGAVQGGGLHGGFQVCVIVEP